MKSVFTLISMAKNKLVLRWWSFFFWTSYNNIFCRFRTQYISYENVSFWRPANLWKTKKICCIWYSISGKGHPYESKNVTMVGEHHELELDNLIYDAVNCHWLLAKLCFCIVGFHEFTEMISFLGFRISTKSFWCAWNTTHPTPNNEDSTTLKVAEEINWVSPTQCVFKTVFLCLCSNDKKHHHCVVCPKLILIKTKFSKKFWQEVQWSNELYVF